MNQSNIKNALNSRDEPVLDLYKTTTYQRTNFKSLGTLLLQAYHKQFLVEFMTNPKDKTEQRAIS